MLSYGGPNHINLGKCKECFAKSEQENQNIISNSRSIRRKTFDPMVCPECGGRIRERNGRNGKFLAVRISPIADTQNQYDVKIYYVTVQEVSNGEFNKFGENIS